MPLFLCLNLASSWFVFARFQNIYYRDPGTSCRMSCYIDREYKRCIWKIRVSAPWEDRREVTCKKSVAFPFTHGKARCADSVNLQINEMINTSCANQCMGCWRSGIFLLLELSWQVICGACKTHLKIEDKRKTTFYPEYYKLDYSLLSAWLRFVQLAFMPPLTRTSRSGSDQAMYPQVEAEGFLWHLVVA